MQRKKPGRMLGRPLERLRGPCAHACLTVPGTARPCSHRAVGSNPPTISPPPHVCAAHFYPLLQALNKAKTISFSSLCSRSLCRPPLLHTVPQLCPTMTTASSLHPVCLRATSSMPDLVSSCTTPRRHYEYQLQSHRTIFLFRHERPPSPANSGGCPAPRHCQEQHVDEALLPKHFIGCLNPTTSPTSSSP
jgi:hypothetical protein